MDPTSRAGTGLLLAARSAFMADDHPVIRQDGKVNVPEY